MFTTWIGYCLLISGLLGLAAFAAERGLHHYRKPVRWAWVGAIAGSLAIPILAFVVPGLFSQAGGAVPAPAATEGLAPTLLPAVDVPVPAVDVPVPAVDGIAALPLLDGVLGWFWGLGVALMSIHLIWSYRRLRSEMRSWTPGSVLDAPVLMSRDRGPAVIGVRRPVIVMPDWIAELEEDLLRLVFIHEREHQRAGDHRLFALGIAALVLMPWNILLWWQVSRLRLAIEFDCDRRVLARDVAPRRYAEALLAVGSRVSEPMLAAAAFAERQPAVERRLRRMTEPLARLRVPRSLGAAGVAALAIVLVLGAPPPAGLHVDGPAPEATVPVPSADQDWTPAPRPSADGSGRPMFIPYDRPPQLLNGEDVSRALNTAYPEDLRDAGVRGRAELWLYIDEHGEVGPHELKTSSGNARLDAAAEQVVGVMRFNPAVNRDRPTPVWVTQWILFQAPGAPPSPTAASGDETELGWGEGAPLIVIDGVIQAPATSLEDLRALDIDNVEVVKGEAALGLYGSRARNGVVRITTKSGSDR